MVICPKCQAPNRDGVRFCKQCGQPIGDETSTKVCANCGGVLPARALFCRHCGTPVVEVGLEEPEAIAPTGPPVVPGDGVAPEPTRASERGSDVELGGTQHTCPFCGAALRERSRFCNQCGNVLPSTDEESEDAVERLCPQCGAELRSGARFCRTCGTPTGPIDAAEPPRDQPTWPPPTASGFGTGSLLPMQMIAGRYLILEKIAQGGMGAIYKARDQRLQGKTVVLKEMSETAIVPSERDSVLESFTREAELLARLDHPNLVKVTDYLQEGQRHYMVMEFIEGSTLQQLLESQVGSFSEKQVLAWAEQLCSVLAFLHGQSPPIVYRDIKPGNVMITEDGDQVKLIDFGIARFYKPGKRRDTIQFGTDGYAPPEQYGKAQTDARADVYALGATLHQLLTMRDPGDQLFHFDPVRRHARSVSSRVGDAVAKAVEMNKDRRHQSVDDFWRALSGREPTWSYASGDEDVQKEALVPEGAAVVAPGTTASLSLGRVKTGRRITRKLTLPPGEGAKLVPQDDWLRVDPAELDEDGGEAELTVDTGPLKTGRLELQGGLLKRWVSWHTARLVPTKREYQSRIHVEHESGPEDTMAVSVVVTPGAWQIAFGWFMTLTAMLVELGIPALTVVAFLQ